MPMSEEFHNISNTNSTDLLSPTEIINTMIDLKIQLAELQSQIKELQPAFFAACMALNAVRGASRASIKNYTGANSH